MRNEINMYLCDVIVFNVDDTVRKRPLTKERSEEKEESGRAEDVIDFTYKAAASTRMMDFLSNDKTPASVKEKKTKSLHLEGLIHSTVF